MSCNSLAIKLALLAFFGLEVLEATPIKSNDAIEHSRVKRSFWPLPKAYEKKSPVELQLMYCKFILDYANEFDHIYVAECDKFVASYILYTNFMRTQKEELEEKRSLQQAKREEDEHGLEREAAAKLSREKSRHHVLRNS